MKYEQLNSKYEKISREFTESKESIKKLNSELVLKQNQNTKQRSRSPSISIQKYEQKIQNLIHEHSTIINELNMKHETSVKNITIKHQKEVERVSHTETEKIVFKDRIIEVDKIIEKKIAVPVEKIVYQDRMVQNTEEVRNLELRISNLIQEHTVLINELNIRNETVINNLQSECNYYRNSSNTVIEKTIEVPVDRIVYQDRIVTEVVH